MIKVRINKKEGYAFLTVSERDNSPAYVVDYKPIYDCLDSLVSFEKWGNLNDFVISHAKFVYSESALPIDSDKYAIDIESVACYAFIFLTDVMRNCSMKIKDKVECSEYRINEWFKGYSNLKDGQLVLLSYENSYGIVLNKDNKSVLKLDEMDLLLLMIYKKLDIRSSIGSKNCIACIKAVDNRQVLSLLGLQEDLIKNYNKSLIEAGSGVDVIVMKNVHCKFKTYHHGVIKPDNLLLQCFMKYNQKDTLDRKLEYSCPFFLKHSCKCNKETGILQVVVSCKSSTTLKDLNDCRKNVVADLKRFLKELSKMSDIPVNYLEISKSTLTTQKEFVVIVDIKKSTRDNIESGA